MTSPSDQFEDGQRVWEAFTWMSLDQQVNWRIRPATFTRSAAGYELLHYDDGRVDHHWPTSGRKAFRTHVEAVAHCTAVLVGFRRDIEAEIERLMDLADESAGPGRGGCASEAVGTAPPEVAK